MQKLNCPGDYPWQVWEEEKKQKELSTVFAWAILVVIIFSIVFLLVMTASADPEMTKKFEGFRSKPYVCSQGAKTIGYGFNLSDPTVRKEIGMIDSISREKADQVFEKLYARAKDDVVNYLGKKDFEKLDFERRNILIDMAYNMGGERLKTFKKMKKAIHKGNYDLAAKEMKDSLWYKQTGHRARHHVNAFKGGAR